MTDSFVQDVRYGLRMLVGRPGFALVAILTMALAIGANTAIFSVVNAVLLKPLGFPREAQLYALGHQPRPGVGLSTTTPGSFYDWQSQATVFDSMAAYAYTERTFTTGERAERVLGGLSAGSVFDVLRVPPALGRTFTAREDGHDAPPVIVLSDGLWRRFFDARRDVLGSSVALGGVPHAVIGVMPAGFRFPDRDAEYWIPARFDATFRGNRDQYFLLVLARLKEDVRTDRADVEMATILGRLREAYPQANQNVTIRIVALQELLVGSVRTQLLVFLAAVGLVLLIACANLANLLLARVNTRQREIAVRQALGAGRLRVFRQFITESLLLAILGGMAGLVVGRLLLRTLVTMLPPQLPRLDQIALDPTVLLVAVGLSLSAGFVFGVVPAMQLSRGRPVDSLRDGARGSSRGQRLRSVLVISEVALAVSLLVGAGLLIRSFTWLQRVDPGFRTDHLLTFRVSLPVSVSTPANPGIFASFAARKAFFEELLDRMRAVPGVQSAALSNAVPLAGRGIGAWFNMLDRPVPSTETPPGVPYRVVSPGYFEVLGVPLKRGRLITGDDRVDRSPSVVINETLVRRFYPDRDPIGREIYLGTPDNRLFPRATIVGIVGDVKESGLGAAQESIVYVPHGLMPSWPSFSVIARTVTEPAAVVSAARGVVRQLNPTVPMFAVASMDEVLERSLATTRSSMLLLAVFAGVALTMAVVGVFGVLSYSVTQRSRELGIRLALGADARRIRLLVLRQGMGQIVVGLVTGLAGAVMLTRLMATMLYGVAPGDPATMAAVAVLLSAVGALACYLPARRATRADAMVVLRAE